MASDEIYRGPGPFTVEPPKSVVGFYTAADQAVSFGVPPEQVSDVSVDEKLRNQVQQAHNDLEVAMEHGEVIVGGTK